MVQKTLACFAVAMCLLVGTRQASAAPPPPPSYLAQLGVRQIDNLATAYEKWLDVVCPIYVDVVAFYAEEFPNTGLPAYYSDLYKSVVVNVAVSYINTINSTADVYLRLVTSSADKAAINAARDAAILDVQSAGWSCVLEIHFAQFPVPSS